VDDLKKVYDDALGDFYLKFQHAMAVDWEGTWSLAEGLTESTFDLRVRQFRKSRSLGLLAWGSVQCTGVWRCWRQTGWGKGRS
jgi:hypothetical protein